MRRNTWVTVLAAMTVAATMACGAAPHDRADDVVATAMERYAALGVELSEREAEITARFDEVVCLPIDFRNTPAWYTHLNEGEKDQLQYANLACERAQGHLRRTRQTLSGITRQFTAEALEEGTTAFRISLARVEAEQLERVLLLLEIIAIARRRALLD